MPPLTPLAAAVLHVPAPERALAIECGEGDAPLFLAREFPSARVRGVDSSAVSIHAATDRVGLDPEGRVAFKVGSRRALPYPEQNFDLVVQEGGRVFIGEVKRVLRSGGHLVYVDAPPRLWLTIGAGGSTRRLRRRGLEPVWSEEVDGRAVHVMRLAAD